MLDVCLDKDPLAAMLRTQDVHARRRAIVWQPAGRDGLTAAAGAQTRTQEAMRQLFQPLGWSNRAGNLEPGNVCPDQVAPIIRKAAVADCDW